MSSSDEEADLYGVENGSAALDGDGENIGLSRRDRRAAKRDQKKWDERKDAEMVADEDDEEDDDAASAEVESKSSDESEERPARGRPRKNAARDVSAGGTGRGTRGRRGQAASNQRLLPFGRRTAPPRRTQQRTKPSEDNELLDRYGYHPRAGRSTRMQGSRSQRARRRQLQRGFDDDEADDSSDEKDQQDSQEKSIEEDEEELRDDQIAEILDDEDQVEYSEEDVDEDASNSEIEDDLEVIGGGQRQAKRRAR